VHIESLLMFVIAGFVLYFFDFGVSEFDWMSFFTSEGGRSMQLLFNVCDFLAVLLF